MDPKKTVILLIDNNNDFLSEGGKLTATVNNVLRFNNVISHINTLIDQARSVGVTIVHAPFLFSSSYKEMGEEPSGIFEIIKKNGAFQRGTWGAKIADVIALDPGDIVLDNKCTTCAFATTQLDEILHEFGITDIVLGGLLTNICIESTMRTAYDKGYKVHALTDGCATFNAELQEASIRYNWPMFSSPVTHIECMEQLGITSD